MKMLQNLTQSIPIAVGTVLLFGLLISYQVAHLDVDRRRADDHSQAISELATHRAKLEGTIKSTFNLTQGLVDVIAHQGDIDKDLFQTMSRQAIHHAPLIKAIALAPNDTIRQIYPLHGNEAAVGLRYATIPEQHQSVVAAREQDKPLLAGPYKLVQGGSGLILRAPIFTQERDHTVRRYWGVVSIVAPTDAVLAASGIAKSATLEIALRTQADSSGPGRWIMGDERILQQRPIQMEVAIPGGSWELLATRKTGWTADNALHSPFLYLGIANTLLLAYFVTSLIKRQQQLRTTNCDLRSEIAERSRTLDDLRLSEQKYASIFNLMPDMVGITRLRDGTFLEINDGFEICSGWQRSEVVGRSSLDLQLWEPETRAAAIEIIKSEGRVAHFEFMLRIKSGERRHAVMYLTPILVEGEPCLYFMARDIHNQKLAELRLQEAKEAAESANRAKTEFLATISHELRTPLNGVMGGAQLLAFTPLDSEQQRFLDMIQDSAKNELALINDLLDLTAIEAGAIMLHAAEFQPSETVQSVCAPFRDSLTSKGITFEVTLPAELPVALLGDQRRLGQIIANLLVNASKFTSHGSISLLLSIRSCDEQACLLRFTVSDTGIGIAPELLDQIFSPFFQADMSSTRKVGGTGLGLAICRKLTQAMGGTIWAESVPGFGSSFHLEIPFNRPAAAAAQPTAASRSGAMSNLKRLPRLSILAADDSASSLNFLASLLQTLGHQVTCAVNGQEALAAWREQQFDVLLLDIQMPLLDGEETMRAIRRSETASGRHTPILALTAHAMEGDQERFLAAGFDGYVAKPIEAQELVAQIERHTTAPAHHQSQET